jgi:hypothetical protein
VPRGARTDDVDARVDALYAGPPEDFVVARDRLAADLKASGDAEAAKSVKALRRPTVAAWALNQLARQHPDEVQALLDAGRELREAQSKAMAGGGPEALREATVRRRAATRALVDRAGRILSEAGRGADAQRDAVAGTLDAAALDEDVGRRLVEGRLEREEAPPSGLGGLEQLADVIPLPSRGRAGKAKAADAAASAGDKPGRRPAATKVDPRVERLTKEAREARSEADRLDRRATKLEEEARKLEREAQDVQARASRARAEARTVRREARDSARRATSAESAALRASRS